MSFAPIAKEIKEQILQRVKDGTPVLKAAAEHGVSTKTIYNWLAKSSMAHPSILEISRLKREKEDLLKVIGLLTLEVSKAKKKKGY